MLATLLPARASVSSIESEPYSTHFDQLAKDDLLTEQLNDSIDSQLSPSASRDFTDDLEDIVRIPVEADLRSRRSRVNLKPPQSSTSTYNSPSSPPHLHPNSSSDSLNRSSHRTSSPSYSPPKPRASAPPSRIPARARKSTGPAEEHQSDDGLDGSPSEKWETLQVGTPMPKNGRAPSPDKTRNGVAKGRPPRNATNQAAFPTQTPPTANSATRTKTPPLRSSTSPQPKPPTPSSASPSHPRQRAKTQNWAQTGKPSSIQKRPSPSDLDKSTSPLSSKPARNGASPASSSMARSKTTDSPSPSARLGAKGSAAGRTKPRQRSMSAGRPLDFLAAGEEDGPLPPWASSNAPLMFKDDTTGEYTQTGRMDNLVLPAVARRLEAERLAKLEEQGLISEWDRQGRPSGAVVSLTRRATTQQTNSKSPSPNDVADTPIAQSTEHTSPDAPPRPSPAPNPARQTSQQSLRPAPYSAPAPSPSAPPPVTNGPVSGEKEANGSAGVVATVASAERVKPATGTKADADEHGGGCCGSCVIC